MGTVGPGLPLPLTVRATFFELRSLPFLLLFRYPFLWRNKSLIPLFLLFFSLFFLLLKSLLLFCSLFGMLSQEKLSTFNLQIDLASFLWWWKWCVGFLRFVCHLERFPPLTERATLEMGQKSVPIFVGEFRVFCQFALDHELFDMIDWMYVCHAIFNNAPNLFKAFVRSHRANRVSLDEYVRIRK
jgi:hypothetical protein